jgi:hypothetical protein
MTAGLLALALVLPPSSSTQLSSRCDTAATSLSAASFIECARAGTERYRDQAAAILDGYRRIGRDFPGMGEHWIRVGLVFDGGLDASRPEVLIYVPVNDKPQLLGVAYATPLLRGEKPPDGPVGPDAWHDHSRTVDEETVLPLHHMPGAAREGARLAMMHAWIWSPNPEGMFAADNWAIPYIRLGLTPHPTSSASAAKALSLATGGRDYFELAIESAARSQLAEKQRVKVVMDRAQAEVESLVRGIRAGTLGDLQSERLRTIWTNMWRAIDDALGAEARQRVEGMTIR